MVNIGNVVTLRQVALYDKMPPYEHCTTYVPPRGWMCVLDISDLDRIPTVEGQMVRFQLESETLRSAVKPSY